MKTETENVLCIKLCKNKTRYNLLLASICNSILFFMALNLLFRELQNNEWNKKLLCIGLFGIFYFGVLPLFLIIYRNKNTGLKITNEGYLDLTSGEFVHWRDVIHIRLSKNIFYRNYILIDLVPKGEKQTSLNRFFSMIHAINSKILKAPAFIYTGNLDMDKERLLELLLLKKRLSH